MTMQDRNAERGSGQRGVALVAVLCALAILGMVVAEF